MAGKQQMIEFMGQMVEVVQVGMTKPPTVIYVDVPAPKITVKAAEVSISPQVRVNMPELPSPDVQVISPPPAKRIAIVEHSDGTKSTLTIEGD